jgi:hypothetical protein
LRLGLSQYQKHLLPSYARKLTYKRDHIRRRFQNKRVEDNLPQINRHVCVCLLDMNNAVSVEGFWPHN